MHHNDSKQLLTAMHRNMVAIIAKTTRTAMSFEYSQWQRILTYTKLCTQCSVVLTISNLMPYVANAEVSTERL
eukprot:187399-Amphidinium_carterae.1